MRIIAVFMLSCVLSSCALTRDYVSIEYKPYSSSQRILGAEHVEVAVNVKDLRPKENIGCKINGYGIEMASIMANNDVAEVFKNAIISELQHRGFVIASEGHNLNIELYKFYNDFKPGFFSSSASSESVLHVTLKKKNGQLVYSKTIFGLGEENGCFLMGGNNASLALEMSLSQVVQKLMNDSDFISALMARD